jgi:hypothetical protein
MATPDTLKTAGLLEPVEVELDGNQQPQRLIYAHPRADSWLNGTLPQLEADGYVEGALTPEEQADTLFYQFISGATAFQMAPNCLRPKDDGIWELRTHDLRVFGWFWRKGVFIISSVEQAKRCKQLNLYAGYREQAKHDRNGMELDEPKFIPGELEDVL